MALVGSATVWIGSRDQRRGKAAVAVLRGEDLDARFLSLDVSDDRSVAAAAEALAREISGPDALVNNAGISTGWGPPSEDTIANVRAIYEVNVFGAIRATQAFLPLLKTAPAPRVVMISSSLGSLTWAADFNAPMAEVNLLGYNSLKSALNTVTVAFAKELAPFGLKVNAGCPGYTATDLNEHTGSRTPEQGAAIGVTERPATICGGSAIGLLHHPQQRFALERSVLDDRARDRFGGRDQRLGEAEFGGQPSSNSSATLSNRRAYRDGSAPSKPTCAENAGLHLKH